MAAFNPIAAELSLSGIKTGQYVLAVVGGVILTEEEL